MEGESSSSASAGASVDGRGASPDAAALAGSPGVAGGALVAGAGNSIDGPGRGGESKPDRMRGSASELTIVVRSETCPVVNSSSLVVPYTLVLMDCGGEVCAKPGSSWSSPRSAFSSFRQSSK